MRRPLSRHFSHAVLIILIATCLGPPPMFSHSPFAPAPLDALFSTTTVPSEVRHLSAPGKSAAAAPRELVIIDDGVENWLQLASDIEQQRAAGRAIDYVVLDPGRDGVQQITEILRGRTNLQAVHLVSHGAAGVLQLGTSQLHLGNVSAYASLFATWGDAFAANGDLLLYGCNLAGNEDGQLLVESLSLLTATDVAASDDRTGNAQLGGDWQLEARRGAVETSLAFSAALQKNWIGALDVNIDQAWLNARGTGPYYLDQANTRYVLQTNVSTAGTAFAIIANNVTFDLNGHTVTYDNSPPIVVSNGSFEQGSGASATGWNFANAPNAQRFQGVWLHNEIYDGNYALKFSLPGANQFITSTSTVTLEANTTYSLSAMFEYGGFGDVNNPGVKSYVRLVGSGLPTREVSWNQTNWRGIQLRESTFKTGNTAETYTVQVGIEGGASVPATNAFIDDIKIQKTKVYGVFAGATSWATATFTDMTRFGQATNFTVRNGVIRQGSDNATWAHAVFVHDGNNGTISNLDVTVQGANSSAIFGFQQGPYSATISNNTLTSNVRTITSRDAGDGNVVQGFKGVINGNTINNGPLSGIWTIGTGPSQIFDNTVRLKARYTNGFAIIGDAGSDIYNNVIECGSGEYSARGIRAAGTATDVALVYGNVVRVQMLPTNQEYQGVPLGGAYGIQLEDVGNIEVYQNQIFAYANGVEAHAFRANSLSNAIYVHDNQFQAISDGTAGAWLVKLLDVQTQDIRFEDNSLSTNYGIIGGSVDAYIRMVRSRLTVSNPLAATNPVIFESDYAANTTLNALIELQDTIFADAWTKQYFDNATARTPLIYGGSPENRMAFAAEWTARVTVKQANGQVVPGATVVLTSSDGTVQGSGTTDQNGVVSLVCAEFRTTGATKKLFNDYRLDVTIGGQTTSRTVTLNSTMDIDYTLGSGGTTNTAPTLDNTGTMTLVSLNEDQTSNAGQSIATIIASAGGDRITDPDQGALEGVAIVSANAGNGVWQYSTNAGASWSNFGNVSETSALLLGSANLVRFVPNGLNGTTAQFSFRAWDQTAGSSGSQVNVSTNGGTTSFSAAVESASIVVTNVNDAPALDGSVALMFVSIHEDQNNNAGQTVASIIASAGGDRITDVDSSAVEGVAITAAANGNGAWQYSLNGGSTWTAVGSVSSASALLLRDTDWLRFVPDTQNGTSASLTFRAWDQSSGTAGTKATTAVTGGTSAFSGTTASASITVASLNDAPVLDTSGTMALATIPEDQTNSSGQSIASIIASAGGDRIADVDSGAVEGIAIASLQNGNGWWQFSIDNGTTWQNAGTVSGTTALLLRATDLVRFRPNAQNGTTASLTFRAWDQSTGATGTKVDTSTSGGNTAFSSATETATIVVTSVNDAPVLDSSGALSLTAVAETDVFNPGNSVAQILASSGTDCLTDVDSGAVEGIAITAADPGNGTWQFSLDGGNTWGDLGARSESSALLLRATDWVRYVPSGLSQTSPTISFRGWDQSSGTAGSPANTASNGGTSAFSTAIETASITVNAVQASPYVVQQQGTQLIVYGNQWNNYFSWSAYAPNEFYIDGYRLDVPPGVNSILFMGEAGDDTIQVNGTPAVDTLLANPTSAEFHSGSWLVQSQSAEALIAFGEGGADTATLNDSTGDDLFSLAPDLSEASGSGFSYRLQQFATVAAQSGGQLGDEAYLYDSSGNDTYSAGPDAAQFSLSSGGQLRALGFRTTRGYSYAGADTAQLSDSRGDDRLLGTLASVRLTGDRFFNNVAGFGSVNVVANGSATRDQVNFTATGATRVVVGAAGVELSDGTRVVRASGFKRQDIQGSTAPDAVVELQGTSANDTYRGRKDYSVLDGGGTTARVNNFNNISAFGGPAGNDTAYLFDTAGDDLLQGTGNVVSLSSGSYRNTADGFDKTIGYGTVGQAGDVARFNDTAGTDQFWGYYDRAIMKGPGYETRTFSFARTNAISSAGGGDTANLFDSAGDDNLVGDMSNLRLYGNGFSNSAQGFSTVYATAGGKNLNDRLDLADSAGNDEIALGAESAQLLGSGIGVWATGFGTQIVRSSLGGADTVRLSVSGKDNNLLSYDDRTIVSRAGLYARAESFANIYTSVASGSSNNRATFYAAAVAESLRFDGLYGSYQTSNRYRRVDGFNQVTAYYNLGLDSVFTGTPAYALSLQQV